jgi:thioredoxin reductase
MLDVIVVGAGPAGLSAALILGRCRRNVLVCNAGRPRNWASRAMHGFLTRDGVKPSAILQLAREQLRPYDSVRLCEMEVVDARCLEGGFEVTLADGTQERARKLLLATGMIDALPEVPGIEELYGTSVFHCPYCDGWELRDEPLAIYGRGEHGHGLALELTVWSRDLVLCTDGTSALDDEQRQQLARHGVAIREERISRLEGHEGRLERIVFRDGGSLPRRGMFFKTGIYQRSELPRKLGCEFNDKDAVKTGDYQATRVPGLFVAGDASERVQLAIIAAAEGALAAFAINTALWKEEKG